MRQPTTNSGRKPRANNRVGGEPGAKSRVFQGAGGGQVEFSANKQKLQTDNRPFQSTVTPSRGREVCRQKRGHETDRHAVVAPPRLHADLKHPAPFLNCGSETQEPSQDTYLSELLPLQPATETLFLPAGMGREGHGRRVGNTRGTVTML